MKNRVMAGKGQSKGFDRMKKTVLMAAVLATTLFGASIESKAAALVANIDVSSQTMTVSKYGQVLYRWSVSTARKGYFTPRGSYRPQWTARMWYSRKYEMSPMPYSVFFRGGYAIHGTGAVKYLGRPASHGCVRLHTANAATFYSMVREAGYGNTRIVVTD
jgi:lipoprotein-anchoring transpeptidase ErfK/SrfK